MDPSFQTSARSDAARRVAELEREVERLAAEARALRRSEERYRWVFEHSGEAVLIVDPDADRILDANEQACRTLGYPREEILTIPISTVHPDEMQRFRGFVRRVLEQRQAWTDDLSCVTKDGQVLDVEVSASVIEVEDRSCLIAIVRDVTERNRLTLANEYLRGRVKETLNPRNIIGSSPPLQKVIHQVEMVAPTDASVLIMGESGTGKELVASAIHEQSSRRGRPLVTVNCASIPSELFESEFFGHVKGSFTGAVKDRVGRFEMADRGTLFLDEIGEIPRDLQGKLLRVLQEGSFERVGEDRTRRVDVRILAATNRAIREEVREGRFRQDLYYRLSVFPIEVPPLRDRREDIAPLAQHFVREASRRLGLAEPTLGDANVRVLEDYPWPGNVRELQNVVERAMILGGGKSLPFQRLLAGEEHASPGGSAPPPRLRPDGLGLDDLAQLERGIITDALKACGWKIYGNDGAARRLGLKPTTLTSRMRRMGIRKPSAGRS